VAVKTRIEIEIPQDVTVKVEDSMLTVNGPLGQVQRNLYYPGIDIEVKDGNVVVYTDSKRRKVCSVTNTTASHVKNMIIGVHEGYSYRMKVVYSHFPIQVKVEGNRVVIENFLGERKPRYSQIIGKDTKVEIAKEKIMVKGIDKEAVGQTMANIEQSTKIRNFDPRVFQDGIYPVAKAARGME
jgi:large subunit ribosomal protein L6